jgi:HAD superfamily hydrolase (TIGR01549 family)
MSLSNFYLNSDLRNKILNAIKSDAIEFVSFDIFDTLVRRDCNKPSDIFNRIAEHAILKNVPINCDPDSFRNSRIYFEKKARLNSSAQDVTLEEIYAHSPYPKKIQQALIEIEKNTEILSLFPDPVAKKLITEISKYKKIIAISDMYLDSNFISNLLSKHFPEVNFSRIFISSETKLTKASGDMYSHVLKKLEISAHNILHIGDNVKSDFNNAIDKGIKAFHYNSPSWLERAFKRESTFQNNYSTHI